MAIAAIPSYVPANALAGASPGLRFGIFFQVWGNTDFSLPKAEKFAATKKACSLAPSEIACLNALRDRQVAIAQLIDDKQLFVLDTKAVSPFTTGLGNAHPLENGFSFLNPYGLPYLPGSGVKGVLRQAARELRDETAGWTDADIIALFGSEPPDGRSEAELQRGALSFWDVIPQIEGKALAVEIMTPHQTHYYQKKGQRYETPHESGQPNPIHFLTVPPGSGFAFHVQCDRRFLGGTAAGLLVDDRWRTLLAAAFAHAFDWLGFGAKTSVGYGAMQTDEAATQRREREAKAAREAREAAREAARLREAEAAREQVRRDAMSPIERSIDDQLKKKPDPKLVDYIWLIQSVEAGVWTGADKVAVAQAIQVRMGKDWKPSSNKPDKDKDHQRTLKVKKWLEGG